MVIISVFIYGLKIILKFLWENGFLKGGFHGTPLGTNGRSEYLMQLSVNILFKVLDWVKICFEIDNKRGDLILKCEYYFSWIHL